MNVLGVSEHFFFSSPAWQIIHENNCKDQANIWCTYTGLQ